MAYKTKAEKKAFKAGLWKGLHGKKRTYKRSAKKYRQGVPRRYRINKNDPKYIVAERAALHHISKFNLHRDELGPLTLDYYYRARANNEFCRDLLDDYGRDLKK